jgi:hypothetical protein
MTKYIFHNQGFDNKKEVDTYIKSVIHRIIYEDKITTINRESEYYDFFIELVESSTTPLNTTDISHFCFNKNEFNGDDLYIVRNDNSNQRIPYCYSKLTRQPRERNK